MTFVNAPALAAERGVTAEICKASESPNHRSVVDVRAVGADGSVVTVSGTLYGPQLSQKIVQINGRHFDLRAQGINLIIHYVDRPGALGKIGTLLGTAGVNIQAAQLSEDAEGRARRFCCGWTKTCPTTCGRRSRRRWTPTSSRLSVCREPFHADETRDHCR